MEVFLNELSLQRYPVSEDVIKCFENFGNFYKIARIHGVTDVKIHSNFYEFEFAPNYYFATWLADHRADEDLKILFKSVFGSTPYIDELVLNHEEKNNTVVNISYEGKTSWGFGLANELIFDSIAFSFNEPTWKENLYDIVIENLQENDEGHVEELKENSTTKNISSNNHLQYYIPFITSKISSSIHSGKELWKKREELFPNLTFCDSVASQIANMYSSTLGFSQIINRLFDLQNVAMNCKGSPIKPEIFKTKTSPESDTRLKTFKNELTIMCPDGKYRLFSWHSRCTPGAIRIYFEQIEKEKFLIGSIANQNTIK